MHLSSNWAQGRVTCRCASVITVIAGRPLGSISNPGTPKMAVKCEACHDAVSIFTLVKHLTIECCTSQSSKMENICTITSVNYHL